MHDLTEGNIYKTFIWFAVPMVLAGFLSQAYNIVNTIIAGKFLGETGLAAIGSTAALITLISSVFWGYGSGFSIYVARLFGAKDYKKIKDTLYSNCLVMIIASVIIGAVMIIFYRNIFDFLQIEENLRREAFIYFSICVAAIFPLTFNPVCVHIMNALGISSYPFYMSIVSTILNIGGNIFAVAVLKTGVAGLAISTVLSALAVTLCYFHRIYKCFKIMRVANQKAEICIKPIYDSLIYTIPTMFQQLVMYISSFAVSPIVNGLGSAAMAAYTVVLKIYDINSNVYQNSSKILGNYTAQCVGAKKYGKIKNGVRVGLIQGTAFVLPVILICAIFAKPICSSFFPENYAGDGFGLAVAFSKFFLPFVLLNLINNLFHAFFRGMRAMGFLLSSTLVGSVSRIIASILLAKTYGIYGVYAGWAISWLVEAIFVSVVYISGKWKPREMKITS